MADYEKEVFLSWDDIQRTGKKLARRLNEKKDWKGILCITRGGLIPAGIVSRELNIHLVETICIHSYAHKDQGQAKILKKPDIIENDGDGWLVIDDLTDTGKTFRLVRELYPKAHYACLYIKPAGKETVDTYIDSVGQETWIDFPWDLTLQPSTPIADQE